ncbi:MAG: outer membrane protein assembly factor BamE (lipoprotein component of BamABCDE complex) [Chlamydiales bacterium]|jgi:outer membrane protein assembly factor BamE (lipoprotein component of BamABCDE complex)
MNQRTTCTLLSVTLACALGMASCVNVDPDTGETIPRGNQALDFDEVKDNAERLMEGMTKTQVQVLLGSPAEKSSSGNVWVYLPERPAVVVPGRALQLKFEGGRLVEHGFRAIVLGAKL